MSMDKIYNYNFETKFIGRENELKKLSQSWTKHAVFCVFGIRSVGKSKLVTEFLQINANKFENVDESGNAAHAGRLVFQLDLRVNSELQSLYSNLCAWLQVLPEHDATKSGEWSSHIIRELCKNPRFKETNVVLFFDNAENIIEGQESDQFLSFIVSLIRKCRNVKTFLTSTTKVQFAQDGRAVFSHVLLPMGRNDSLTLLTSVAPYVDLGECKDAIIKLSEGIPLLLLMIGAELSDEEHPMTPEKMVELLSKCRLQTFTETDYSRKELLKDAGKIFKNFILRLTTIYQERLKILEFIPGSFNAAESRDMLDYDTVARVKGEVLVHLHRRFMVVYDRAKGRFDIQGILRECLQMYFTLSNITEVRRRYCQTFSRVFQNIADRLGTTECSKALKDFAIEQANLRKFLQEVLFSKEDTYPFFLEVASSCALLIENFMEGESEKFYNGCLCAAEEYGRPGDKAIIRVSIGSLYTNIKEDLPRGADVLQSAIEWFLSDAQTRKIHLATAYQRLGWNLHKQGKNEKAVSTLKKSYAISSKLDKDATLLRVQNMNSLGLTNDMLGNFQESGEFHFGSLGIRRAFFGHEHPFTGMTINNIGMHFKKRGDFEKALEFFVEGLRIKRLNKTTVISLVDSMNNVAEEYINKQLFDEAEALLDEAMDLLNAQKVASKEGLALTYNTRGMLLEAKGQYRDSVALYEKAVQIRRDTFPDDIGHFESLVQKSNVEYILGDYSAAMQSAKTALKMKDVVLLAMPYNMYMIKCLECIANIHKAEGHKDRYKKTIGRLESELLRLERIHVKYGNEKQIDEIQGKLLLVDNEF